MLEWLKNILGEAYTDEVDVKVSAEIGKNFVSKADFNQVNTAKKKAEDDVKARDQQLEDLKKSTGDAAALQEQISQYEKVTALILTDPEKLIRRMVRLINSETSTRQVEVRSIHDRIADGKKRTACISNDTPAAKKNNKPKNTKTR